MKKPNDNKLPLPKRYRANPTTGEVLYEYICASEKLRAAAMLHIYDSLLQLYAKYRNMMATHVAAEVAKKHPQRSGTEIEARTKREASDAKDDATSFRDVMLQCGLTLPLSLFNANPCPLTKGIPIGGKYLIASLADNMRYQDLHERLQFFWEGGFMSASENVADPEADLKALTKLWSAPNTTTKALRDSFREALKRREATLMPTPGKRGRASQNQGVLPPSSALNDLWHYLILRGVAGHTGRRINDLLSPDKRRAKPQAETLAGMIAETFIEADIEEAKNSNDYSVKLSVTPDGGLDTAPIKAGARKATKAIEALESDCPSLPAAAIAKAEILQEIHTGYANSFNKHAKETNLDGIEDNDFAAAADEWQMEAQARASNKALMPRLPKMPSDKRL